MATGFARWFRSLIVGKEEAREAVEQSSSPIIPHWMQNVDEVFSGGTTDTGIDYAVYPHTVTGTIGTGKIHSGAAWFPPNCRSCGKEMEYLEDVEPLLRGEVCGDCQKKWWEQMFREYMIPKDSEIHCQECSSHINACSCESNKKLKQLRG